MNNEIDKVTAEEEAEANEHFERIINRSRKPERLKELEKKPSMQYKLVARVKSDDFNKDCTELAGEGWRPHGYTFLRPPDIIDTAHSTHRYEPLFCQAWVRW